MRGHDSAQGRVLSGGVLRAARNPWLWYTQVALLVLPMSGLYVCFRLGILAHGASRKRLCPECHPEPSGGPSADCAHGGSCRTTAWRCQEALDALGADNVARQIFGAGEGPAAGNQR